MIKPFTGNYPQTQGFGENPQDYAKFGLVGHNGLDFGLPSGTNLISAIAGKVIEVANDPTGYGLYIKIENDTEGFLVAHLQQQDVQVGQNVDQGQHIGVSNNTGNSTGPHLHLGYFRKPRDRTNGYAGYIDPTPYFDSGIIPPTPIESGPTPQMNDQTKIPKELLGEDQDLEIQQIRGLLQDGKRDSIDLTNCRTENEQLKKDLQDAREKPPTQVFTADLTQVSVRDLLIAAIKKIFTK